MVLHGKIGKLGEKRGRTEINIMLKEGTCNHQENKRRKEKNISAKVKVQLFYLMLALCGLKVIFIL